MVILKGVGSPEFDLHRDGVVQFDPATGKQSKPKSSTLSYTQFFAEALIKEAEVDDKIVAIHAAMGGGTGLNFFQKKFPKHCFDVGIAEQHAITFATGLAIEGLKPFCVIYSSFLQRGYDQVVHDVDVQKLPVRFAMDRAGLVGADGPTHCGVFDIAYMACLPNMVVMAPSDESELIHMVAIAAAIDDRPNCFRFPRGNGIGAVLPLNGKGIPIERDNYKRRLDSHQFESNGSSGISYLPLIIHHLCQYYLSTILLHILTPPCIYERLYGQHVGKKQKLVKQSLDNLVDSVSPVNCLISSPVASQMSNISNPTKFIKMLGGRDRDRKTKGLKSASGQPGSGTSWSLFEDQKFGDIHSLNTTCKHRVVCVCTSAATKSMGWWCRICNQGNDIQILRCGPPPMNKAMAANLEALGYTPKMQFQF